MIPFTKGHANGNDFILVYAEDFSEQYRTKNIIYNLCSRHTGIGADGLLIISPSKKYDFELDYYNCDGSWETLCANGSRCAIQFMYLNKKIEANTLFVAGDGVHAAKILKKSIVAMQMKPPKYKSDKLSIEHLSGYFIDSGAKHFVVESANLEDNFVFSMGKKIRYSSTFAPSGINVNFYTLLNNNTIHIKTYEKGVETVMNSCNSGSAAVVFHLAQAELITSPVTTVSNGGRLRFSFTKHCNELWAEGPVVILFNGKLNSRHILTFKI